MTITNKETLVRHIDKTASVCIQKNAKMLSNLTQDVKSYLEEGWHVGSAKMVDGLQSSEHGSPTQTLEVILTDVEHRGPDK